MRLTPVFLIIASMSSTACFLTDASCGRTRWASAHGPVAGPILDTIAQVSLSQGEGQYPFEQITWDIPVSLEGDSVTAVHLHDPRKRILYSFPDMFPGRGYSLFGSTDYDSPVPIATVFELVRSGQTYFDIHTDSVPQGAVHLDLTSADFQDWVSHTCD